MFMYTALNAVILLVGEEKNPKVFGNKENDKVLIEILLQWREFKYSVSMF